MGGVLYLGTDPVGKQQSAVFSGTEAMEELVNEHNVSLRQFMDDMEAMVK